MDPRRLRLTVAVLLFLGWIGYLGFLVATTRDPVVVSRSQFLAADLVVVAEVAGSPERPEPRIRIQDVPFAQADEDRKLAGTELLLADLPDSGPGQGWQGPGTYLLPLQRHEFLKKVRYEVASLPPTPGFYYRFVDLEPERKAEDDLDFAGPVLASLLTRGTLPAWETLLWPVVRDRRRTAVLEGIFGKTEGGLSSGPRKRNVPFETAKTQRAELERLGIPTRMTPSETRIYPATADALQQVRRLASK